MNAAFPVESFDESALYRDSLWISIVHDGGMQDTTATFRAEVASLLTTRITVLDEMSDRRVVCNAEEGENS